MAAMRPMPGDSRQFSLLTIFVVTTVACSALAAKHWLEVAPWLLPRIIASVVGATYLFVIAVIATDGFGRFRA